MQPGAPFLLRGKLGGLSRLFGMQVTLVCAAWVKFAYSTPICLSVTMVAMLSFFSWAYVQHNWAPYVPPHSPTDPRRHRGIEAGK